MNNKTTVQFYDEPIVYVFYYDMPSTKRWYVPLFHIYFLLFAYKYIFQNTKINSKTKTES